MSTSILCKVSLLMLLCAAVSACAVLKRSAVPEASLAEAKPYGISGDLRIFGDTVDPDEITTLVNLRIDALRMRFAEEIARGEGIKAEALALSGGGPDGAFGVGVLNGWSKLGSRPEFEIVTGISTGALIAPFAFLGSDYDEELAGLYTNISTEDLVEDTLISGLISGTAIQSAKGLRSLIETYVDAEMVAALAEEHRRGRLLLIGTTNLDASRPVSWNIGAIAASGHPQAARLIHDVILASAAVPAAFPPVLIPVQVGGKVYDEMHVDGGATQQVTLFSPAGSPTSIDRSLGVPVARTVYVIFNNQLERPYEPIRPRLPPIAGASISTLISRSGTGDLYKIFSVAQRDGLDLRIMSVPRDFDEEPEEAFDQAYMKTIYQLGYEMGLRGEAWRSYPPGYAPIPSDGAGE